MYGVGIAACDTYERSRVVDAIGRALEPLGGMGAFVKKGDRVLLKPNLLYPRPAEKAVTTHPEIVRATAELALSSGAAEVLVGDSPGLVSARTVTRACGIDDALAGLDTTVVDFDTPVEHKGSLFPSLELDTHVDGTWVIINLPKAKTHVHAGLTLSAKNLFGCVPGLRKSQWHLRAGRDERMFARLVVDIARTVNPALNIIDAIVAMEGNGPGSGTPRQVGRIVASPDPFAADAVVAEMLQFRPEEMFISRAAQELGIGPANREQIELFGDGPYELTGGEWIRADRQSVSFSVNLPKFVVNFLHRHATPRPHVDADTCKRCGHCAKICPPKAITMHKGKPADIDYHTCIRCFCCQEICPVGAITAKSGMLSRIFGKRVGAR